MSCHKADPKTSQEELRVLITLQCEISTSSIVLAPIADRRDILFHSLAEWYWWRNNQVI